MNQERILKFYSYSRIDGIGSIEYTLKKGSLLYGGGGGAVGSLLSEGRYFGGFLLSEGHYFKG